MDDLLAAVPKIYVKEALHANNGKEIVHQHNDHHQTETIGQVKNSTQTTIHSHLINVTFRFQKYFLKIRDCRFISGRFFMYVKFLH